MGQFESRIIWCKKIENIYLKELQASVSEFGANKRRKNQFWYTPQDSRASWIALNAHQGAGLQSSDLFPFPWHGTHGPAADNTDLLGLNFKGWKTIFMLANR